MTKKIHQKYPYFKNKGKYLFRIKQNWENSLLTDLNCTTRNVKRSSSAKKKKWHKTEIWVYRKKIIKIAGYGGNKGK